MRFPALHDALELRHVLGSVMPEPAGLDEAATQWRWGRPVLAGEIVFADRLAGLLVHRQRLARRVQWVLDLDIKAFFDSIEPELLMRAVRKHTDCPWAL